MRYMNNFSNNSPTLSALLTAISAATCMDVGPEDLVRAVPA